MHPLALEQWAKEASIPLGTRVMYAPDVPETDTEENPIFAFLVDGTMVRYWTGKPIKVPFLE